MAKVSKEYVAYLAFVTGAITRDELVEFLADSNAADGFNDWLAKMPAFVLEKWDGVHYDAIDQLRTQGIGVAPAEKPYCPHCRESESWAAFMLDKS